MHCDEHQSGFYRLHVEGFCASCASRMVARGDFAEDGHSKCYTRVDGTRDLVVGSGRGSKCKAGKFIFLYYSYTIYSATQTAAILGGSMLAFAERLSRNGTRVESNAE